MPIDPLQSPCTHAATREEQERDPNYFICNGAPGLPCTWAKRYDGVPNPPFHAERLAAARGDERDLRSALDTETFREAVLDTGLV